MSTDKEVESNDNIIVDPESVKNQSSLYLTQPGSGLVVLSKGDDEGSDLLQVEGQ